jgi:putative two-component system response regulator
MEKVSLIMEKISEKATILVVDDTPDNLALMSNLLKSDYKVKVASGGEKALKIAGSEPKPDLILLDVMMPGMDGYEVCRQLKEDATTRHIPVIFLTAKAEAEDEAKGMDLGAVDYISKPISPPIVLARVKSQLALHRRGSTIRDLRAPLEEILKFAESLRGQAQPDQLASLAGIVQAGRQGLRVLDEVLAQSRTESL